MFGSLDAAATRFSGCEPRVRLIKNCANPKKVKGEERKRKIKTNQLSLYKMKTRR
jgi:hypothetical protein